MLKLFKRIFKRIFKNYMDRHYVVEYQVPDLRKRG